ncbi:unnamed protein product [Triticum turgidum subsp. durum]|uniref:Uncharacterized protein n=1 Tax=Triticum turgidum subsp. durum TaxID=4567 RepID=A0A9R0U5I5_TRITD|nr:unnamed protein product [Triticum turgidum subsp. durum]
MEVAGSMGAIAVTGCQELDEFHAGSTLSLNLTGGVAVQTTPVDRAGESGKSMISMQINLLFWTGFDVAEYKGYTTVNHVIVYQTIKLRNKLREAGPDPDDSQNQAPLLSLSLAPTLQMANNTLPATAAVQLRARDWRKTIKNKCQV